MVSPLLEAPFGRIRILWRAGQLIAVDLDPDMGGALATASELPDVVRAELERYFADGTHRIELPVRPAGSPFQQRVWAALRAIPPGRTRTYGELARELGTGPRAIGQACRCNPVPILVPCHRVVACDGLGGFAGDRSGRRLAIKRWLLRHEGAVVEGW